ncbi:sorting nexin-8-like [Cimex lectularius]|uniref:PX domain-containing protein n=1 Tax=Cimex lectularius TaxID=79782 RepID=A0A8I6TE00_CIMLE|nr:sorting nexin-8-like [Cimex lectularius]
MARHEHDTSYSFKKLEAVDTIKIGLVPEKKGLFLKHVEYVVTSKRFGTEVNRRYNDFVAFYELLLNRFPYRLIPKLPPKKIVGVFPSDSIFLENRRKGLERWLTLIARHPIISLDAILHFFLTQAVPDLYTKIKEVFKSVPDEFTTSELAAKAKELIIPNNNSDFAASREHIRIIHLGVQKMKAIADHVAFRSQRYSVDMEEMAAVLTDISLEHINDTHLGIAKNENWKYIISGLKNISKELELLSMKSKKHNVKEEEDVCERLSVLLDILSGHQDLCERVEKGVSHDHQSALSKMMALKKRQIQGVLRGSDAESVAVLENRMLQQENVIASVELRTAFSLYCVKMETALVFSYLETLVFIMNSLVAVQVSLHSELAEVWKLIQSAVQQSLPKSTENEV